MAGEAAVELNKARITDNVPYVFGRDAIQSTIRRYSWQSVAVRLASIALVAWYFAHLPMGVINPLKASVTCWPVVCLFLMWLWEGHIKSLQSRYCELYENTGKGAEVHLSFPVPKGFNVSGLWIPTVVMHYSVLIGLCALVILGF
jgi:hypothetical protein